MNIQKIISIIILAYASANSAENIVQVGAASMKGRRSFMEDAHDIQLQFGQNNGAYFALFDGHGFQGSGRVIAEFVREQLPVYLARALAAGVNLQRALIESFETTDRELFKTTLVKERGGSCALIALIDKERLTVANLGDSRALICRKGKAIVMTQDHHPDKEEEKERIVAAGGLIFGDRLLSASGSLALSRSFGDREYKENYGVIATPEVMSETLTIDDEFIILGCDGIFEKKISSQDAVDIVRSSLAKNRMNAYAAEIAAQELIQAAYDKSSGDNLSALVILFRATEPQEKNSASQQIVQLQLSLAGLIKAVGKKTGDQKMMRILSFLNHLQSFLHKNHADPRTFQTVLLRMKELRDFILRVPSTKTFSSPLFNDLTLTDYADMIDAILRQYQSLA